MNGQKKENLLNLSLEATAKERASSPALQVGINEEEKRWEVIIKYNGSLESIQAMFPEMEFFQLSGGYAVVKGPEPLIEPLAAFPQVEYMEKPKRLYFTVSKGIAASCIPRVREGSRGLTGKGVLLAVIDSGIDYWHEAFREEDGNTRILELWDQETDRIYREEEINNALKTGSREEAGRLIPVRDGSGHGTAVAGIAAAVAKESRLLIVKLGTAEKDSFPRTTELMRALDYVINRAASLNLPVAVNLSFGNTYGSHDGRSLLETYMDSLALYGRTVIVAGTGNEGSSRGHTSGRLKPPGRTAEAAEAELLVGEYEKGFGVQLWKEYADRFSIELIGPDGTSGGRITPVSGMQRLTFRDTTVLLYYGMPSPYSRAQEIYFDFIPAETYVGSGSWRFRLIPEKIVLGYYDFWLPSEQTLNLDTRFLSSVPDTTLTIPSTAARVISVGAYDDSYRSYAAFSGRGYNRLNQGIKPDLAAPGVDIITARAGGGYEAVTGTSFAAPFVTGSAALMMQWGITDGNDPYLYGEKVKAYLIRGAGRLEGETVYPNQRVGYGVLCLDESFP